jgi:hypothetical protein
MDEDTGEDEPQLRQLEAQRVAYQCLMHGLPVPAATLAEAGCAHPTSTFTPAAAAAASSSSDAPSCSGMELPALGGCMPVAQFTALRNARAEQRVTQRLQQLARTRASLPAPLPLVGSGVSPRRGGEGEVAG